jgi:hypothetical protein
MLQPKTGKAGNPAFFFIKKITSRQSKISPNCISNTCKHKQFMAGGYVWKFKNQMENNK